jgi:hypothetical protein
MYPVTNLSHTFDVAADWNIDVRQLYPIKIICVPAMCTQPGHFAYKKIDFSMYDLVVISDIEYFRQSEIRQWITEAGINDYVLALGGTHPETNLNSNELYRPWWSFNLLKYNQPQFSTQTPEFDFDCLLGARRPHRDFAMLAMQHTGLIDSSIVTYRDFFQGASIDHQSQEFAEMFPNLEMHFPFVSSNLDPSWEVDRKLDYSISPFVPWNIYNRCRYSIITETLGTGDGFFMSEKTGKAVYARRIFLLFSNCNFLSRFRALGFETFGSVIDESYDSNPLDFARFTAVMEQMKFLSQQNYHQVLDKLRPVLDHNQNRLLELQKQSRQEMQQLLDYKLNSLRIR